MSEKIGLFAGSFDPLHLGHVDVILRGAALFDRLIVLVGGENPQKSALLSVEKRLELVRDTFTTSKTIEVRLSDGTLTAEQAKKLGATVLVRSVRGVNDVAGEASLDFYNRELVGLETVVLFAKPEYAYVTSTAIRELLRYGKSIRAYVPEEVADALEN
ncbi:MAG: pantetheine-phosphate adenylyltransferase [Streptococcaceae bacterium]|jgi:pantetheine-phosphate adenylyltransferase|nr:pantetheine-phosphate adenylyltransferase [Streptococcaceae bacterium]